MVCGATNPRVNLDQDIQGLFKDYFVSKHKQEPNDELLELFNEIIGSQLKTNKTPFMLPLS
jgi:exonuclease SbcD